MLLLAMGILGVYPLDWKSGQAFFSLPKVAFSLPLSCAIVSGLYFQVSTYLHLRVGESLIHIMLYLYPIIADNVMCVIVILSSLNAGRVLSGYTKKSSNMDMLQWLLQQISMKTVWLQIALSFTLFCVPYFLDIFYYHSAIQSRAVLYQALSYIFVVYNFVALNQFSISLIAIKKGYQKINSELFSLYECSDKDFKEIALTEMDTAHELYDLRNKHYNLYKICRIVNWMHSPTTMGLVIHHGIMGVIHSYWGLRQTLSKHQGEYDLPEMINTFRSVAVSFLSIIYLVLPTTALRNEVDKTQEIIQRKIISAEGAAFKSEVKTFSLQMMVEKLTFSPFGFFELSNELLLAMLGAIASYLIVLLQYQLTLDEQMAS